MDRLWITTPQRHTFRTVSYTHLDVYKRQAQGQTNRQIAEDMCLAEKTVKNYVTSILGKLGMERRTQAAVFAVTHPQRKDLRR